MPALQECVQLQLGVVNLEFMGFVHTDGWRQDKKVEVLPRHISRCMSVDGGDDCAPYDAMTWDNGLDVCRLAR